MHPSKSGVLSAVLLFRERAYGFKPRTLGANQKCPTDAASAGPSDKDGSRGRFEAIRV